MMNIDNLGTTTPEEIDAEILRVMANRGAMYDVTSELIMLDNRPDFFKLHRRGSRAVGRPNGEPLKGATLLDSLGHLYVYIHMGWEVGILNTLTSVRRQNVTKAQLMEVFMAGQLTGGPRGAECIYRSVWMVLKDYQDALEPPIFPDGWEPDPAAFQCGLDLSTEDLTDADYRALTGWYERNLGYLPKSVEFSAKQQPYFLKAWRAKFEGAFSTGALPKQLWPYFQIRYCTVSGFRDGLREAAELGKAWGMSREYIIHGVTSAAYYQNGMAVMHQAQDALADIL
jgi:hypothetical protein